MLCNVLSCFGVRLRYKVYFNSYRNPVRVRKRFEKKHFEWICPRYQICFVNPPLNDLTTLLIRNTEKVTFNMPKKNLLPFCESLLMKRTCVLCYLYVHMNHGRRNSHVVVLLRIHADVSPRIKHAGARKNNVYLKCSYDLSYVRKSKSFGACRMAGVLARALLKN